MTCEACQEAEANPHTGLFHAGCKECAARSIAGSLAFFQAKRAGRQTAEYKRLLTLAGVTHESVKQWAERLKGNNE